MKYTVIVLYGSCFCPRLLIVRGKSDDGASIIKQSRTLATIVASSHHEKRILWTTTRCLRLSSFSPSFSTFYGVILVQIEKWNYHFFFVFEKDSVSLAALRIFKSFKNIDDVTAARKIDRIFSPKCIFEIGDRNIHHDVSIYFNFCRLVIHEIKQSLNGDFISFSIDSFNEFFNL